MARLATNRPSIRDPRGGLRRAAIVALAAALLTAAGPAMAEKAYRQAVIAEPYLELHTGPASGYPVHHVVERGEQVAILKRRTDWMKVRTRRGVEGWAPRARMELTMAPSGDRLVFVDEVMDDFVRSRWEMGAMAGDFGGANMITVYGALSLSANLSTELWVAHGLGDFSNSVLAGVNIVHEFFPGKRISPQFALGTGMIRTSPNATLVETEDRTDQIAHAGLGLRAYITRQFVLRAEYKTHVVFTSRDDNEEIDEWKAGFSFFF